MLDPKLFSSSSPYKAHRYLSRAASSSPHTMATRIFSTREITPQEARPQNDRSTIFKLPGELRNKIYSLVLDTSQPLVPQPPIRLLVAPRQDLVPLLLSSSLIFHEARGLLENYTTAYIPVKALTTYETSALPSKRANTTTRALEEFMNVHFHLHITITYRDHFRAKPVLDNLHRALKAFMAHSQAVSEKYVTLRYKLPAWDTGIPGR
ncbi:hypothetical protein K491DRAFT_171908 [Lophiostoma macrostomum CBS 122681]|uniref:F-box domain-containing protein n=1 Tax=Lophiostoma macrostomum CBS 122681 TaxID=1314788 RepID=A0A6A6STJ3_9PLEO|nr:hypothetical protein K491DRAFT_171908 [Lophiostoma macrostomum CBS 122681]